MTQRRFHSPARAATLLIATGLAACKPSGEPAPTAAIRARPSVLLISLDTLRADRLGCYGYDRPTSPVIDGLAANAVLFEDVASPSAKTATSHMSMFTGLHPGAHGVRNTYGGTGLAPHADLTTIFQAAKAAGYITVGFTGGGMMSAELGFGRGFDLYDARGGGGDRVFQRATQWCAENLEALEDEPLLLFVHTYEIHDPYTPPLEWQTRFVDAAYAGAIDATRISLPENAAETWKTDPHFYTEVQDRFWGGFDGGSAADVQYLSDLYDAGIAYTDDLLGQFLGSIAPTRFARECLVVLTSDHGDEFQEHGNLTHQSIYQEILHVPLIFKLPSTDPASAARAGVRIARPVRGIDLGPSLAEWCGVQLSAVVQGLSLLPEVRGATRSESETWSEIGTVANELASLRAGPYKLLALKAAPEQGALYDLSLDPRERFDRLADYPEMVRQLGQRLSASVEANSELARRYPPGAVEMGAETLGALQALGYTGE